MKITDLLQGIGAPISFFPDLVPLAGSHHAAIFLCQLTYWHGKQSNPQGWIYKTQEEWYLETELSEYEQKNARRFLVNRGFIEERFVGIPRRLEYRLKEQSFNKIWDCWQVACDIKKRFKELNDQYGFLASRGCLADDIKIQLHNYRASLLHCQQIASAFFNKCKQIAVYPIAKINELAEGLQKVVETLKKSIISQTPIMVSEVLGSSSVSSSHTAVAVPQIQGSKNLGNSSRSSLDLPPGETLTPQAFQTPSKNTPEISSKTSTERECAPPPLQVEIPKNEKMRVEVAKVEVVLDPHQDPRLKKDLGQNQESFMKTDVPGGGAEAQKISPEKIRELQENVRLGKPLPRMELVELAKYYLGGFAGLYRHSGEVLSVAPNDIKLDFLHFVQWFSFNNNPDISYVRHTVLNTEKDPERWGVFMDWLEAFRGFCENPDEWKSILMQKVASQGRKASGADLALSNQLALDALDLSGV